MSASTGSELQAQTAPADMESPAARSISRARLAIFALVALLLFFVVLEGLLWLLGFHYSPVPILADNTWGKPQVQAMNTSMNANIFGRDDLLFFSLTPGAKMPAPDPRTVNSLGLLDGPVAIPKPVGMRRILCLGDSCTAQGPVPYPDALEKRLGALNRPDRRYEVINAGVYSYTSFQGLRLFRERLRDVQPDLVTVYYGWNDHYLTAGYPDNYLLSSHVSTPAIIRLLRHLRLYQLVFRGVNEARMKKIALMRERDVVVRVSADDYRANLTDMVELARERGARPLLITAPSNHRPDNVPAVLIEHRHAESVEALIERHNEYNDITRRVAAETKADLFDLAALMKPMDTDRLFLTDGIHPNPRGLVLVAESLAQKLGEIGFLAAEEREVLQKKPAYDSTMPNRLDNQIRFAGTPVYALAGQPTFVKATVKNTGDTLWRAKTDDGIGQVRIGTRVLDEGGNVVKDYDVDHRRTELQGDLAPGGSVDVLLMAPPMPEGRYTLEADPVSEMVAWFNSAGDERSTAPLIVGTAEK